MKLNKILDQATSKDEKRYLRFPEYTMCKGLTEALRQLENEAKESEKEFNIISSNAVVVVPRIDKTWQDSTIREELKEALIERWASFVYDGYLYYIQLDDNPFFDNMITKQPLHKDEKGWYTLNNHYGDKFSVYDNMDIYDIDPEQYKQLTINIIKGIKAQAPSRIYYRKEKSTSKNYLQEVHYNQ